MSITLRGRETGLSGVPRGWRGPLPDLSVQRRLLALDGYAAVPAELLHGGFSDLAVLTWTLLRLSFDDRSDAASYPEFAEALGLGDLTASAMQQRFQPAIKQLLGTWITRQRAEDNVYLYRAIVPARAGKRYAMLRRGDLGLLQLRPRGKGAQRVTVAHLAGFARWQLECGRRGWTADSLATIAARWNVSEATLRRSRDALVEVKFLEVTPRPGGRFTDLVWLRELYDPHWAVPSDPQVDLAPSDPKAGREDDEPEVSAKSQRLTLAPSRGSVLQRPEVVASSSKRLTPSPTRVPLIRNLTGGSLTGDLTDLGGASATPLTSVPWQLGVADPQAARSQTSITAAGEPAGVSVTASSLLTAHPQLATADPQWRAGMLATMRRALGRGLEPGHLYRALGRVLQEGEVSLHCEIVRSAVKQAWADQRAGMCADCGSDPGEHRIGCAVRGAEADNEGLGDDEIRRLIVASLERAEASGFGVDAVDGAREPGDADPLLPYLDLDQVVDLGSDASPSMLATWLTNQLAGRLAEVAADDRAGRLRALDRSAAWWADQLAPAEHEVLEDAVAALRLALTSHEQQAS